MDFPATASVRGCLIACSSGITTDLTRTSALAPGNVKNTMTRGAETETLEESRSREGLGVQC